MLMNQVEVREGVPHTFTCILPDGDDVYRTVQTLIFPVSTTETKLLSSLSSHECPKTG